MKNWASCFEAGVGVGLDEVDLEGVVEHEVEAENFKGVAPLLRVQNLEAGADGISHNTFDLAKEMLIEVNI